MMIIGCALLLVALVLQGLLVPVIEKIYVTYEVHPLLLVGWQGLVGTVLWSGVMVVLMFVGCPFSSSQCVVGVDGSNYIENAVIFF
jgi:hypothetical protein